MLAIYYSEIPNTGIVHYAKLEGELFSNALQLPNPLSYGSFIGSRLSGISCLRGYYVCSLPRLSAMSAVTSKISGIVWYSPNG